MKRILALITTLAASLVFSSTALANSLTCGHGVACGPGDNGGVFASQHIGRSGGPGGTLPFTGLNLATVAVIAALLIASGLTLRWATRHR